jgi:uncharacterized protein (DUF924 family)
MTKTSNPMIDGIREVLDFWFAPSAKAHWFEPSEAFDRAVAEHLGNPHRRAASGDLEAWQTCARGCLALCILLDQVPRQIYRGEARAFATDALALGVATLALGQGLDRALPAEQRLFLYLPLMHSEHLADQERCVALFDVEELRDSLHDAVQHAEVIRRFGRFPHRDAALAGQAPPRRRLGFAGAALTSARARPGRRRPKVSRAPREPSCRPR